jgi:DnaJ-class molecular chaperone
LRLLINMKMNIETICPKCGGIGAIYNEESKVTTNCGTCEGKGLVMILSDVAVMPEMGVIHE